LPPRLSADRRSAGQALVETALVLPLFLALVFGTIVIGLWIFYQAQVTTTAREMARYAAVHSASSDCPVGGWLQPAPGTVPDGAGPWDCDSASAGWPNMTADARQLVFGMDPTQIHLTACWAGYHDYGNTAIYDAGPYYANDGVTENPWYDCTMESTNIDPLSDTGSLACPSATSAADGNDTASNLAVSDRELAVAANRVVVYACYNWSPPLAGFLLIPDTIVIRAVYSEGLQHQR
jgi:hypothetical protein